MRILFLLPYTVIPPDSGNKNLTYNLLKYCTTHARCDLVLLVEPGKTSREEVEAAVRMEYPNAGAVLVFERPTGLKSIGGRFQFLARGFHPGPGRYCNNDLREILGHQAAGGNYDIVHFDMFLMAQYWNLAGRARRILVASDAYSNAARLVWQNTSNMLDVVKARFHEALIRRYERYAYPLFDLVCTVSEVDEAYLRDLCPSVRFRTIGIALEESYRTAATVQEMFGSSERPGILCTGSINHPVVAEGVLNFFKEGVPGIVKEVPWARVTLLGRNPAERLRRAIPGFTFLTHVDYVDDYLGFLQQNWVYVYPQKNATGLQTKVQQAMSLGIPVVAYQVSLGGLAVKDGIHCLIAKDVADMARKTALLLKNKGLRVQIGESASAHIRERFSIVKVGSEMMRIYEEAIGISNFGMKDVLK